MIPANGGDHPYGDDIEAVLITEEQIKQRTCEMAQTIGERYINTDDDLLLIGVLKGAIMFMTDFARALPIPSQMEFMAVSSYGSSTSSSGVVRILKDLDRDIADRDVLMRTGIQTPGRGGSRPGDPTARQRRKSSPAPSLQPAQPGTHR